jgi:uncharacterized protein YceK
LLPWITRLTGLYSQYVTTGEAIMKLQNSAFSLILLLLTSGCATLLQGTTQQIMVSSTPAGATVVVDGSMRFTTPAALDLARKESHKLEINLDGYHPEIVNLRSVSSNMAAGNIVAGGLIGFAVDYSNGAAFRLVPELVKVNLRPIEVVSQDPPAASPVTTPDTGANTPDQP